MSRKTQSPAPIGQILDDADGGIRLLSTLFRRAALNRWKVDGWREDACLRSAAVFEMFRQTHEDAGATMFDLTRIWEAVGSPADSAPAGFMDPTTAAELGITAEVRADDGRVWGDRTAAVWYCHYVDHRNVDPGEMALLD